MALFAQAMKLITLWIFLGWTVYFDSCQATTMPTPLPLNCSKSDSSVCSGTFCEDYQDVEIKVLMCPHFCGFCNRTGSIDCTVPDRKDLCSGNICSQLDKDLAKDLCPHLCGHCGSSSVRSVTTPPVEITTIYDKQCKDHLTHGHRCDSVPHVCDDPYGREICPKHCGICASITPDPTCVDHIYNRLSCEMIPSICKDPYAKQLCRKFCNECHIEYSFTPLPPQQGTTSASSATATSLQPLFEKSCQDSIGNGMQCAWLNHICEDMYGNFLCRHFCGTCVQTSSTPTPQEVTTVAPGADTCVDHVVRDVKCSQLPNVCSSSMAKVFCPKHCGLCGDNTATPTGCDDHLVHYNLHCSDLPGGCNNTFVRQVCRKFCGVCTGPTASSASVQPPSANTCADYVGNGMTCAELPGVCKDPGFGSQFLCPRTCGACQPPATTTPAVPLDGCVDHIIYDYACDQIPNVCKDRYAVVCRKFCGLCNSTNTHTQPPPSSGCVDRVGAGLSCQQLPGICADPLGPVVFCPHYCGGCTDAPTTATTATTPAGCQDNVGEGKSCDDPEYAGICGSPNAQVFCPKHCGLCGSSVSPPATQTPQQTTIPQPMITTAHPLEHCMDNVGMGMNCSQLRDTGFCSHTYSMIVCRKTCGHCVEDTTTPQPTTTAAPTPTSTITTTTIPATTASTTTTSTLATTSTTTASTSATTSTTTASTSGTTSTPIPTPATTTTTATTSTTATTTTTLPVSTTPAEPCVDHLKPPMTCAELNKSLEVCQSPEGRKSCPLFCGECQCKPLVNPDCQDDSPLRVCNLPGFCDDLYAKVVCKKTCEVCDAGCRDKLLNDGLHCTDWVGPSQLFGQVEDLCKDDFASRVCQKTCNCEGYCKP